MSIDTHRWLERSSCLITGLTLCFCIKIEATELIFFAGGGKQLHTHDQHNRIYGADLNLFRSIYSEKHTFVLGASIATLETDTLNSALTAFSIYPQLNLSLPQVGTLAPYFYVRTLAPTYISETQLGERKQAYHFVFQSQVGLGSYFGDRHQWSASIAYRHYSNAGLGTPNEGMDALLLFTLGARL